MIHARESIAEFMESKVASDLAGITTPDIKFSVRGSTQPPEFPNCLNLYFFDDNSIGQFNPHYRQLTASIEFILQLNPITPLVTERHAMEAIHKINQFMAVQSIPKTDYSVSPSRSMGSGITWRDSYPLDWRAVSDVDDKYVHKSCFISFLYWEEKVIA